MRLTTLFAGLVSVFAGLISAQQTVASKAGASNIISQYGDSFKNAGGGILQDKVNVYVIFYGNWSSTQSKQDQATFLNFVDNISTSPWFSLFKQYTDANGKAVTGPLNLAAAVNDAGSHQLNLTTTIHKQIVSDAVNSGYLSPTNRIDNNGIYVIMGGPDVGDADFCRNNCGYNSYSDEFQYMFIGHPSLCPDKCMPQINKAASPNNSPAIDAAITIFSHELQDTLTDPRGNAWVIKSQNGLDIELADFCSSEGTSLEQFGNLTTGQAGSYNLEVAGGKYLVQTIFDLASKQCKIQ